MTNEHWAITGTGLLTSVGTGVEASFAAFCRGESGLGPLRGFDATKYRVRRAYEVPDRDNHPDGTRDVPGRATRWLSAAVAEAVEQAGLGGARPPRLRVPVVVGTGLAEQRSLEIWWSGGCSDGVPLTLDQLHFGAALRRSTGLGPTFTLVNACSAGLFALALGTDLLQLGTADAVVVAGTDAITESMFGLLDRVTMAPPEQVRPFDADRRGVILGEGAAAVVLEPLAQVRDRGVRPLAVLRAVGTSCDAHHVTAPLREGIGRAMRDAHRRAEVSPDQIDLVLAHGTGTMLNDETEALAMGDVFDGAAGRPVVTALKSLIGHTSGASGLMSLVTAVEAVRSGQVPPTRHHETPIEAIRQFRIVTDRALPADPAVAQVNAFGFGGVNAVAVVERAPAGDSAAFANPPGQPAAATVVAVTGLGLQVPGLTSVDQLLAEPGGPLPAAPFVPQAVLGARGLRYKDRATQLALCAVAHTLADAGLSRRPADQVDTDSFGVVVSTTVAIAETVCRVTDTIHAEGVTATSPMDLPNASGNVAAASVAIQHGLGGLNVTVCAGPTSGVDALYLAAAAIRAGRARRMLVVGVEPASEVLDRQLAATASRHGLVADGLRLFDGAAAVLLESADAAAERGARVHAVVEGYGRADRLDAALDAALDETLGMAVAGRCGHPGDPHAGATSPPGTAATAPAPRLWLLPCLGHPAGTDQVADASSLPAVRHAERLDVAATTGEALAALGVAQCAAAAAWLTDRPRERALISSGGCWGDGYAGLVLRGAR